MNPFLLEAQNQAEVLRRLLHLQNRSIQITQQIQQLETSPDEEKRTQDAKVQSDALLREKYRSEDWTSLDEAFLRLHIDTSNTDTARRNELRRLYQELHDLHVLCDAVFDGPS